MFLGTIHRIVSGLPAVRKESPGEHVFGQFCAVVTLHMVRFRI